MVFEFLKPKPGQRITVEWGEALIDAVEEAYWLGKRGDPDYPFKEFYGYYGYFSGNLFVQGKPVIKDGDPVNIYDIFAPAQERLVESVRRGINESDLDMLKKLYMDAYGRVGVIIQEPLDVYGRLLTDVYLLFGYVRARGSVSSSENTNGLEVVLQTDGKPNLTLMYKVGGAATILVEVSNNASDWFTLDTITTSGAESRARTYTGVAAKFARARCVTTGIDVLLELTASR